MTFLTYIVTRCSNATASYRLKIGVFAPAASVWPISHSSCQNTRINHLSCGIRTCTGTSFFRFVTKPAFDRQTDGQKGLGNTVRCITCSRTVKKNPITWTYEFDLDILHNKNKLSSSRLSNSGHQTDRQTHNRCY